MRCFIIGAIFRYITIYTGNHRFMVGFYGMYPRCISYLAIIYRGVLIFFRVTVEIWYPLAIVAVMK